MGLFGKKNNQRKYDGKLPSKYMKDQEEDVTYNSRVSHSDDTIGILPSQKSSFQSQIKFIDKTISQYQELIKDARKSIKKNQPGVLDFALGGIETYADLSSFDNSANHNQIVEMEMEIFKLTDEKNRLINSNQQSSFKSISSQTSHSPLSYTDSSVKLSDLSMENLLKISSLTQKGWKLLNLGDYDEAIKIQDQILYIFPGSVLAWKNKSLAFDALENYAEAVKCCDKIIKIDPINADVYDLRREMIDKLKEQESDNDESDNDESDNNEPMKILKIRLAKGEITKEEFNQIKEFLED